MNEEVSNGMKIICFRCGECCPGPEKSITMTLQEMDLIRQKTGVSLGGIKTGPNRFKVPMNICPFLGENSCSIYDIRPCQCRMFHCGRAKKEDPFLSTLNQIGELMDIDPNYAYWKKRMEDAAASWGNAHGWSWRRVN